MIQNFEAVFSALPSDEQVFQSDALESCLTEAQKYSAEHPDCLFQLSLCYDKGDARNFETWYVINGNFHYPISLKLLQNSIER